MWDIKFYHLTNFRTLEGFWLKTYQQNIDFEETFQISRLRVNLQNLTLKHFYSNDSIGKWCKKVNMIADV